MPEESRPDRLPPDPDPWYAEGVRFECQFPACTACCGGEPGFVWLSPDEADAIAAERGLSRPEFIAKHTHAVNGRISLTEKPNGDCIFLGPEGCEVYGCRPAQCSAYPFWPEIVASPDAWEVEKTYCPGIGKGRLHTREEIEARVRAKPAQPVRWIDELSLGELRDQARARIPTGENPA